ncbi:hypothetical protein IQ263_06690 [Tychonema sp. LEGE 06208]|nr:hypothetical protein [Tychonema sp. LEGE 06208]
MTSITHHRLAGTSASNAGFYQLQMFSNSVAAFRFCRSTAGTIPEEG